MRPRVTDQLIRNRAPKFAQLGDLRIAYREGGTGDETVILIHGLCSMMYTWKDVFEPIAARHRVIALDLKGYGDSDKPPLRPLAIEIGIHVLMIRFY